MSWSGRSTGRRAEATARVEALRAIGYEGRVNADGDPLDGAGTAVRVFSAGVDLADEDRTYFNRDALEDLADSRGWIDGGCQSIAGDGLEDADRAWPCGYRWQHGSGR